MARLLACAFAVTVLFAGILPAGAAQKWGIDGEMTAQFEAQVVDLLCELNGDCPEACGAGKRQLGLLRDDGRLLLAVKSNTLFAGATLDLLPYCGQRIEVDGRVAERPLRIAHERVRERRVRLAQRRDRIGGGVASVRLSRGFPWGTASIEPQVAVNWQSSDMSNHDFGVPDAKATLLRPAYELGSTTSIEAGVGVFVELSEDWRIIVNIAAERLDDEVRRSPIVDDDTVELPAGEDLLLDGAGVLGVGVDVAAEQRAPQHARAAELRAVLAGAVAEGGVDEAGRDLAENHRLGELLRAHHDGLVGGARHRLQRRSRRQDPPRCQSKLWHRTVHPGATKPA